MRAGGILGPAQCFQGPLRHHHGMTIAHDMLDQLSRLLGASAPRVKALHLPPQPWNGSKDGEFCALELDDGSLGLSYVLLNDTLDEVLAHCRRARAFAMIGPGAGCLPDALFARGVTALGGSWVVDGAGFVGALRAGRAWGRNTRKCVWTREKYHFQSGGSRPLMGS